MKDQETKQKNEGEDQISWFRQSYKWMGVGIEFGIVTGFFAWLGSLLDRIDDTFPGFMILGFFVGFAVMLYIMLKRAKSEK